MHTMFSFTSHSLELFKQGICIYMKEFIYKIHSEKKQTKKEIIENIEDLFKFKEKMGNILEKSFKNSSDMSKFIKVKQKFSKKKNFAFEILPLRK
jgi:hypothetical protein